MLGKKDKIDVPTKSVNLSVTKDHISYQINNPKPTKTCSPSKYIYMSNYGDESNKKTFIKQKNE